MGGLFGWDPVKDVSKALNRTNELLSQTGNRVNMTLADVGKREEAILGQNVKDTMSLFKPGGFNNLGNFAYRKVLQGASIFTGGSLTNKQINSLSGPTGAERSAKEKADAAIAKDKAQTAAVAAKEITDRQNTVMTKLEEVYKLRERAPGRSQTALTSMGSQPNRNTLLTLKTGN